MGDYPLDSLSGLTPLQAAKTPNMDYIATHGRMGLVHTIPEGKEAGSDIANLNILGYDPNVYHTGRAPLEAANMGIELGDDDVAYRCNLVRLDFGSGAEIIMEDYAGGHISSEVAEPIVKKLEDTFGDEMTHFYPGVSYRHSMVWTKGRVDLPSVPPHDMLGQRVDQYLNEATFSRLDELIRGSWPLFASFKQENPDLLANSIWLWGQGKAPNLPKFKDKYGLSGGVISAVDLLKGIGVYAGLKPIDVPGATGYLDTNYEGKVEYTLANLEIMDFLYLHVEAPDEAAHSGDVDLKIKAIEQFDSLVVGPVLEGMRRYDHFRILLITDHYTPIPERTH
ncbi:MAG: cofactor-independent phosphoglycerate mutase, partial [Gammaproteobacteria bacterium]|nr:cofactor-independent phosphoglycerate mutase [Gammaproteobacteria bacterium]